MRHNFYMTLYRTVMLVACAPAFAQQYNIATVAGNGVAGVVLNNPTSVAVDPAGDVYVADWSGLIRKIWVKNAAVTTVAGTGTLGYGGDGGPAVNAAIGRSISLTLDDAGNLYFADGDNHRIRRVDGLTGVIATVAGTGAGLDSGDGGLAVRAGVSRPTGVLVDAAGDLYFSSSWSRVRKVNVGTGIIETVAGQMTTGFGGDNGPAVDAMFWDPIPSAIGRNGSIYITDYENSRVRMLTPSTGIVTTFAGSGACSTAPPFNTMLCQSGFSGDSGPAKDATLNHAQATAMDSSGKLYVADTINHRIRRIDASSGLIFTIAGNGVNGFSGDGGPALAAEVGFPSGIAVDRSGRVYFADENNQRIRVLTPVMPPAHLIHEGPRRR